MEITESLKLLRDCVATQIPSGIPVKLPAGSQVKVTQSLGGNFTVLTETGLMVRIAAAEGDALGKKSEAGPAEAALSVEVSPEALEKLVWGELRTCYDPEIPVNIVDLGLIYLCRVTPVPEGGNQVLVKMTLTAPGCGMGGVLKADAEAKIGRLAGVRSVQVELVVDPPWNQGMMSEAAKLQLGLL
ncbi:MAG: putative Fe-S cluster assembly protein SufT [Candidatus Omnitrophica bacterium]|nr:putative Fe-S cluster assembly protein SufT [Candidatus Omnitrophota bacterium]